MKPLPTLALILLAACSAPGGGLERRTKPGRSGDLPFSDAVRVGDAVYVSGTLGIDPATGQPPPEVEREARLLLDAVQASLALFDLTMDDLVQVQVFCPDLSLYGTFNDVYRTYFHEGFPTRAFIGSGPLLRGARFEMNGVARR
jgi:2-iminobutanoate/2-iminopropanoate deaminase